MGDYVVGRNDDMKDLIDQALAAYEMVKGIFIYIYTYIDDN